MEKWRRYERLLRSKILATPFVLSKLMTRFDIEGQEHLERALARRKRTGRGLITISNHLSLFDDPLVLIAVLGQNNFTVETKWWWSTPCESNFSPTGKGMGSRFVRYFSDVANMVFFARPSKKCKIKLPDSYMEAMAQRGGAELLQRVEDQARLQGVDGETYLRSFLTPGDSERLAPLNQAGMMEACLRISTGDWLHFFPEGGRSRTLDLRPPKRGVGKVLYHCEDVDVMPICFYGTQDLMPVGAKMPRLGQRVAITVGQPVPLRRLRALRRAPASPEAYQAMVDGAWESVRSLQTSTFARYKGQDPAVERRDVIRVEDRIPAPGFPWHTPATRAADEQELSQYIPRRTERPRKRRVAQG